MVYSENPLGRNAFSRGDRSVVNQCGLTEWFLYGARDSLEGFL